MAHLQEPPASDALQAEVHDLRSRIGDLVEFAALPATWTGREPIAVVESFAGALARMLHAELVFLRVNGSSPLTGLTIVHTAKGPVPEDQARALADKIVPLFDAESVRTPVALTGLLGDGALPLALSPLGDRGAHGFAAVGARRAGFPDDFERALLDIAVNQLTLVLKERQLRESEERYRTLIETAREIICTIAPDGRFASFNEAFEVLTGWARRDWIGRAFGDIVHPQDLAACTATFAATLRGEVGLPLTYRIRARSGDWLSVESTGTPQVLDGRVIAVLALVRDVTARARAEEELRQSRRRLEEAEEVAHVGGWEWDLASNELRWSRELYRLFGVAPGEFRPNYERCLELMHPEDRAFINDLSQRAAHEGRDYAFDTRIVRPDGEIRFMHARGHAVREADGRVTRMIGIAQDITDRKRDEQVRRALMKRLISIHEEERARISRELHDGTGQALAALLVGLRRAQDARSLKEVQLAVARQRELVAQALDELGRLARGLRPTVLDDLGLRAALERHTSDQAWLFGFEVTLDAAGLGRRRLPRAVETALYRVAQEALANAARHADARRVCIVLSRDPETVRLTVTDDGCGFEVARALEGSGHLGLHGIRERAALVGGRAEIRSRRGQGTTVSVVAPLRANSRVRQRA